MSEKRKSRHGVHRIPRKDSKFDAFIRNTTAHLLQESPPVEKKPKPEKMQFEDGDRMLFEDGEEMLFEDEDETPDKP